MKCINCNIDKSAKTKFYGPYCCDCIRRESKNLLELVDVSTNDNMEWNYDLIIQAPWYKPFKEKHKKQYVGHETIEHLCWHMESVNNPSTETVICWNSNVFSHNMKAKSLLEFIVKNI